MKNLSVIIGRFQPFHNSHLRLVETAYENCDQLLILIGSANRAPDFANPYSFETRKKLISECLDEEEITNYVILPLNDYMYNDASWLSEVHSQVNSASEQLFNENEEVNVTIYGHEKDDSSYYMKKFPTYKVVDVGSYGPLSATQIRTLFYLRNYDEPKSLLPDNVYHHMYCEAKGKYTEESQEFERLRDEYYFVNNYLSGWDEAPYDPTFVTTDAVVYYQGHVLLVKRKSQPGKGLWSLPGGFLGPKDWVNDGIVKNLKKDTNIRVGEAILKSNIRVIEQFGDPCRSLRGRVITNCGLIILDNITSIEGLPVVKSKSKGDYHAKWFSVDEVNNMSRSMFEDHYFIIKQMLKINN